MKQRNSKKQKNNSENIPGGIISSGSDWEKLSEDWINRSFSERLTAIEILRLQFLEMFHKSNIPDMSVFGKRI